MGYFREQEQNSADGVADLVRKSAIFDDHDFLHRFGKKFGRTRAESSSWGMSLEARNLEDGVKQIWMDFLNFSKGKIVREILKDIDYK